MDDDELEKYLSWRPTPLPDFTDQLDFRQSLAWNSSEVMKVMNDALNKVLDPWALPNNWCHGCGLSQRHCLDVVRDTARWACCPVCEHDGPPKLPF